MTDKEQRRQEDLKRLRSFRLIDDDFMNACFDGNIEGTQLYSLTELHSVNEYI